MKIKNLKKTAQRIKKSIKNKEKIILYGDADLDGVASVIILKETIRNLGGKIKSIYFPARDKEGYGINKSALNFLKKFAPALLITLDCGISNFEEIDLAKKLGFEVIIIDHHEILDKLPKAKIIVDPKQKGDKYSFKGLATAGIVFKLSEILFAKNFSPNLRKNFLELVALATLADMMPQEAENKIFLAEGLNHLEETLRPGLKIFWKIDEVLNIQKIISALNISEIKNHLTESYLLLTLSDENEIKILAENLLKKSYQRQIRNREITEEAEERALKKLKEPIIFEGSDSWEPTSIGAVASRICQRYQKPTFIFNRAEKESLGAVRTPAGINGVKTMQNCAKFLKTFGGHPAAAGFRIKNENLEKFKTCLIQYFETRH